MKPWYAHGARKLLESRQKGMVPNGPVVVSLIEGEFFDVAAATLYAKPDMPADRLDWRMLVNLDVCVWASSAAALGWLLTTVSQIAQARPRRLLLRFEDSGQSHDVEVGTGLHIPAVRELRPVHDFWWFPVNAAGTSVGARLRDALIAKHPCWTNL